MAIQESRQGRRAFFGRGIRWSAGLALAATGASAALAACAPEPDRRTPEAARTQAIALLRKDVDAVRDPNPRTLTQILADEESMFSQVGRALAAVYRDQDPQEVEAVTVVKRLDPINPERRAVTLGDRLLQKANIPQEGYGRYAFVERRLSDGSMGFDVILIPDFGKAGDVALVSAFDTLVNAALYVDIATEEGLLANVRYRKADRFIDTVRDKGVVGRFTLEPVAPRQAALVVESAFRDLFVHPRTHRGPSMSLKPAGRIFRMDPVLELTLDGSTDIVKGVLDDAEEIARRNILFRAPHGLVESTTKQPERYCMTLECVEQAAYGNAGILRDQIPGNAYDRNPYGFLRIVIPNKGKSYVLYLDPQRSSQGP